ncbi:putative alpha-1,2-mannosyltransferase ALG9 [Apostichopus japonicus]|uniref:Mannosyltransferase n=1 Tax=Stichopus japonicus TaxID=307972 RepID=A0A2G8LBS9_STIJA|nr:putative alpha-1,2-mannosyltransferase ALG9 [Apostichopus japonicus]
MKRTSQTKDARSSPTQTKETSAKAGYSCWCPETQTAIKLLIAARFTAALMSNISDCDETFNYWEPTHYLLYGKGFQTWEYSPTYAIRSYAYLFLHAIPGYIHSFVLGGNRLLVFFFVRCLLGFVCAFCEALFYSGVRKTFGPNVARWTLVFLLFSTGMFISGTAYLPSSFSMYMTMISMAGWYFDRCEISIVATAVSTFISWPFACIIGAPIAFDCLFLRGRWIFFIKWCLISVLFVLVPQVAIDSYMYGKLVIAPLNIVTYNVFSEHGPDIYGVEPWMFYFHNGFLNFNVAFMMALVALPVAIVTSRIVSGKFVEDNGKLPVWLTMMPMYLWILVFFTRPHKEERFLFPIYPLFCLAAAVTLSCIQRVFHHFISPHKKQHFTVSSDQLAITIGVMFGLLSLSRTGALYYGYHTPLDLYPEILNMAADPKVHTLPPDKPINICIGKEWYRFPSHFFLPENWSLQYIQSEFRGQLPKHYDSSPDATRLIPTEMNDLNKEEPSRYIDVKKCHYLIDLDLPQVSDREPRYSQDTENWQLVLTSPFLDVQMSPKLYRSFYIPFLSRRRNVFANYNILKTRRRKGKKKVATP